MHAINDLSTNIHPALLAAADRCTTSYLFLDNEDTMYHVYITHIIIKITISSNLIGP